MERRQKVLYGVATFIALVILSLGFRIYINSSNFGVSLSPTGIDLTWDDHSTDETYFQLRWSERTSPTGTWSSWSDFAQAPSSQSTGKVSYFAQVPSGKEYKFEVSACNDSGCSNYFPTSVGSSDVSIIVPENPPSSVGVSGVTENQITLNWVDNADNEIGYVVKRGGIELANLPVDSSTYTDTGLIPGNSYDYEVIALNSFGDVSSTFTATTQISVVAPVISGVSPNPVLNINNPITLTITGTGFSPDSVLQIGTFLVPFTFVDSTQVVVSFAPIPNYVDSAQITITNSAYTSNAYNIQFTDPTPILASISPNSVSNDVWNTLTFSGSGFTDNSLVEISYLGSASLYSPSTVFPNSITLDIPPGAPAGNYDLRVYNPVNEYSQTITVLTTQGSCISFGTCPTINSISSSSVTNNIDNLLTITGTNFDQGSKINVGLNQLNAMFIDSQTLEFTLPAYFNSGDYGVSIVNSLGDSSAEQVSLSVKEVLPVLDSLSVSSISDSQDVSIVLTGSNFYPNAKLRIDNGQISDVSNYVVDSLTTITWIYTSGDYVAGNYNLLVENPGGSVSESLPFEVTVTQQNGGSGGGSSGGGGSGGGSSGSSSSSSTPAQQNIFVPVPPSSSNNEPAQQSSSDSESSNNVGSESSQSTGVKNNPGLNMGLILWIIGIVVLLSGIVVVGVLIIKQFNRNKAINELARNSSYGYSSWDSNLK